MTTISTLDFLQAVYGDDGPHGHLYLLVLKQSTSGQRLRPTVLWPTSMAHAVDLGERLSGTEHIWFGVCPAAQKLQNNKKPTPAHAASMPGLWVDIDRSFWNSR